MFCNNSHICTETTDITFGAVIFIQLLLCPWDVCGPCLGKALCWGPWR